MEAAVFSAVVVYTDQTKQCHMVIAMRIWNCLQENGLLIPYTISKAVS